MEFQIDMDNVKETVKEAVQKAVSEYKPTYQIQTAVTQSMTEAIAIGITKESNKIVMEELEPLTHEIAKEIVRNTASAVSKMIEEAMVNLMFGIRIGTRYMGDDDRKNLKEQIRAELRDSIKRR